MSVDPRILDTFEEWVNATELSLRKLTILTPIPADENWKRWAYEVIQDPALEQYRPPDPTAFDDWREWATRFNETVPL